MDYTQHIADLLGAGRLLMLLRERAEKETLERLLGDAALRAVQPDDRRHVPTMAHATVWTLVDDQAEVDVAVHFPAVDDDPAATVTYGMQFGRTRAICVDRTSRAENVSEARREAERMISTAVPLALLDVLWAPSSAEARAAARARLELDTIRQQASVAERALDSYRAALLRGLQHVAVDDEAVALSFGADSLPLDELERAAALTR